MRPCAVRNINANEEDVKISYFRVRLLQFGDTLEVFSLSYVSL